ncbi:MAG TPA: substrate-binding domain-containing protein [Allocoleopsis sp.]
MKQPTKRRSLLISLGILACALVLTFAPLPGFQQTVTVVSGTELQEVLPILKTQFEQDHPNIKLDLKFQGSQDLVNNYIDDKNDFTPTLLIPGNVELISELEQRWQSPTSSPAFYNTPQPIAKSLLVGVAWADRGKILFPGGKFDWNRLEQALQQQNWGAIGGNANWGSFDWVMTDPERSNSGQLTLALWAQAKLGKSSLDPTDLNNPAISSLFAVIKRSIYQPPRSTDVLLQEFISRGHNQADVATVYESVALHRWQQSATTQGSAYQIYSIDPTLETVATGAIVQRNVSPTTAKAAQTFLDFLTQPPQQTRFIQYGFRPIDPAINLTTVPNSPWSQNIPGADPNPPGVTPPPDRTTLSEILRLWQRAN